MIVSDVLIRQPALEDLLPKIGRPVSEFVTSFEDGRAMLAVRLSGIPFESVSTSEIETQFEALNRFKASLVMDKGNRLGMWLTLNRRRVRFDSEYRFQSRFMRRFAAKYLRRFENGDFFENSFYLTIVLKGEALDELVTELHELAETIDKSLTAYDPQVLRVFEHNNILFSEPYQFIAELLNGVDEVVPVTSALGSELIPSAWQHFHYDVLETRADHRTRFAVCYDLKDFPKSGWGQLNPLLTLPAEFTLTHSFIGMGNYDAMFAIEDQENKLRSVEDKATHQLEELKEAKALVAGRDLAFGEYHGALVVYGDTDKQAIDNGVFVTSKSLNECGFRWVKASLSAPMTFISQVPGAKHKPRPMPKSTRSLAAAFSMHNYSAGKSRGNPIGDGSAVMPLQTVSKGLYSFNFHASRVDEDNTGEKLAGHALMLGDTGAGKTTLQLALIGFLERFDPKIFAIDMDRSMQIFIEELGGTYFALKAGEWTQLAPFALADTPRNREFLYDLVGSCGRDHDGKLSVEDMIDIKNAVDAIYRLPNVRDRRFSRLLENIADTGENCLARRLMPWCASTGGRFAWALDNVADAEIDMSQFRRIGFDATDILKKDYAPTEPILAFLLHLKSLMQLKGGLLATIIEEFWLPVSYPTTCKMIERSLRVGRRADEFLVLVSQTPDEALKSPLFGAILQLTATKIYLPNPSATREGYGPLMTDREFKEFKALTKDSRKFLIKQGNQSAFAMLDLKQGFTDELAVLSASLDNVAIWEEAGLEADGDPERRMELFQQRRKGKRDRRPVTAGELA
ncbi:MULTISPECIES: VirB4 family type IV secretion/conjugal transfer ATPase [Burkholderia]|uniref:Transporter n=1 Tax=Burkholderia contaminans TaxID=488447 RepID=A0ABD7YGJ2_9BURK|nr:MULTISPECIES: transporter [Burkholderia]MCA7912053.1 transporter [Burkholderia contaminans]MCA8081352.1 transporter [Burkholderia cepacia]WFN24025.1 transporter [Burkholderia contaminans]VWD32808.1 putative type IV secretion system protein VirB4 [Burkholderia contaminans]